MFSRSVLISALPKAEGQLFHSAMATLLGLAVLTLVTPVCDVNDRRPSG